MPTAVLYTELDWTDIRHSRWLEMVRFKNRITQMLTHRLPRATWDWNVQENLNMWCHDIKLIQNHIDIHDNRNPNNQIGLSSAEAKLQNMARNFLKQREDQN